MGHVIPRKIAPLLFPLSTFKLPVPQHISPSSAKTFLVPPPKYLRSLEIAIAVFTHVENSLKASIVILIPTTISPLFLPCLTLHKSLGFSDLQPQKSHSFHRIFYVVLLLCVISHGWHPIEMDLFLSMIPVYSFFFVIFGDLYFPVFSPGQVCRCFVIFRETTELSFLQFYVFQRQTDDWFNRRIGCLLKQ